MEMIILPLIKILDNFLGTTKTIFVQKGKALLVMLNIFATQMLFYFVIAKVICSDNILINMLVSAGGAIGSYLAMKVTNKFSKDKMYQNIITFKQKNDIVEMCEFLRDHNIKYIVTDCYNRDWTRSMAILAYPETKNESKMIDEFLEEKGTKHLRKVLQSK